MNIISEVVVERLGFEVFDLLDPYEINYNREVKQVTKGIKISYSINFGRKSFVMWQILMISMFA